MKRTITHAAYTDIGEREINEDSIGVFSDQNRNCFLLCDGLGGHGMGDVASALVTEVFKQRFEQEKNTAEVLETAFMAAQESLLSEQTRRNAQRKMKTTATALIVDDKYAYVGHIGDSRLYIFHRNKVKIRTLDHSVPQMLAIAGEIHDKEIRRHSDRASLLRVLGTEWSSPMYELMTPVPLRKCQAFLLCSDGFWEYIEEADMCDILRNAHSVKQWLDEMAEIVRQNGYGNKMDNNSAIAVWCQ